MRARPIGVAAPLATSRKETLRKKAATSCCNPTFTAEKNDMHCWEVLDRSEKLKIPTGKESIFEDFKERHILGNDS